MKPLPLHAFWPLQSFWADLHAPWPLQAFAPTHLTLALCAVLALDDIVPDSWARTAVARNNVAAAEARIAPLVRLFIVFSIFPQMVILLFVFTLRPTRANAKTAGRFVRMRVILRGPAKVTSHRT
jgi:hypothetical protein